MWLSVILTCVTVRLLNLSNLDWSSQFNKTILSNPGIAQAPLSLASKRILTTSPWLNHAKLCCCITLKCMLEAKNFVTTESAEFNKSVGLCFWSSAHIVWYEIRSQLCVRSSSISNLNQSNKPNKWVTLSWKHVCTIVLLAGFDELSAAPRGALRIFFVKTWDFVPTGGRRVWPNPKFPIFPEQTLLW